MSATKNGNPNRLQWWVMAGMWAIILAGGGAWASNINNRITRLEELVTNGVPTVRELKELQNRLERIEGKIDRLWEVRKP